MNCCDVKGLERKGCKEEMFFGLEGDFIWVFGVMLFFKIEFRGLKLFVDYGDYYS